MTPIYLDYAASAPLDPRVLEAVSRASALTGNPSSIHGFGRAVRAAVDGARASVAALFGVETGSVTFTSGATEANALAIEGTWRAVRRAHPEGELRVLASPLEHASVWETVQRLAREHGAVVDVLPVGKDGIIQAQDVEAAIVANTVLVSVQWANNVLGTIQPMAAIGAAVKGKRADRGPNGLPLILHADAVQAVFTQEILPQRVGVDLLTASGHKLSGPKGIGVLVRCDAVALEPLAVGGGQESGLRHGTENVPGIVGMGVAAGILCRERRDEAERLFGLRDSLLAALAIHAPRIEVLSGKDGLPSTVFLRSPSQPGDLLMLAMDAAGYAVSAGSACDAGARKASRTLRAVFGEQKALHGGIRVSFGRFTTADELERFAVALGSATAK